MHEHSTCMGTAHAGCVMRIASEACDCTRARYGRTALTQDIAVTAGFQKTSYQPLALKAPTHR